MQRTEYQGPPEPVISKCPGCGATVVTFWAAGNQGLIPNKEYDLVADWVFHAKCWDKQVADYNPNL